MTRIVAGILIAVGLVVLIIILIVKAVSGPASSPINQPKPLIDYAGTDVVMQLTIDGQVNADQNHRQLQISIGSTSSQIDLFQGYQKTLLKISSYPNNQNAYAVFLRALDLQGYKNGVKSPSDDRGYCPFGERYIFEIVENGQDLQRYWSSSCGIGNFKGNSGAIISLFKKQIPDYYKQTANLNFDMQN